MIKTILVPASGEADDESTFATALEAARLVDGHLTFLHVRSDPAELLAAPSEGDLATGLSLPGFLSAYKREAHARAERAKRTFERLSRRAHLPQLDTPSRAGGPSAEWREVRGHLTERLIAESRFHDLLVLRAGKGASALSSDDIGAILIAAGRPLLLAPTAPPKPMSGTAVVAWKETAEAARALAAAMPLLAKAEKIVVLSVTEGHEPAGSSLKRLAAQLAWHGLKTSARRIEAGKSGAAEALVAAAAKLEAGLLVAGGYGHSRLRELIFGGVTQRLLKGTGVPVLLFH